MNLLRYTYGKLSILLFVLLTAWGVLFYITILDEITDETDDSLENYRDIIVNTALQDSTVLQGQGNLMTMYRFRPITAEAAHKYKEVFCDSTIYVQIEDEYEPVRVMKTSFMMPHGQYYELELMISTTEREDMIEAILSYLLALFVLLFISMLFITRAVLKKAFLPLDKLMKWLKSIQPGKQAPPLDSHTNIHEFKELAQAAVDMNNRSYKAYNQQKQFIENASHELQTPLAIIRNKIELLADNDSLDEKQMKELEEINDTLARAVKLNKSLLLLTRIENGQYTEIEEVNLNKVAEEIIQELSEIYLEDNLTISYNSKDIFTLECNAYLMHIMLTNLIKNALTHNLPNGEVRIEISKGLISIKNSGTQSLDHDAIFERFYHAQSGNNDSVGLGLSIAKTIASAYNLILTYQWEDGMHGFLIRHTSVTL